jgi:hypothetical protein
MTSASPPQFVQLRTPTSFDIRYDIRLQRMKISEPM